MVRSPSRLRRASIPAALLGVVAALLIAAAPAAARPSANAAQRALERAIPFAGIAFGIDTAANQVVVTVDSSVTGARLARATAAVRAYGTAARLESATGTFQTFAINGGDAIYGTRYRCSLGFNVKSGSTYYFLTAGHCGKVEATWWQSTNHSTANLLGSTSGYTFPGKDYALVRYATSYTPEAHTSVNQGQITSAGSASINQTVTRDGSTTKVHSGRVTALNVTVRYQGAGVVRGLIQTTVCAEGGDSGGPLYAGSVALGLTSGGSGDCKGGPATTFFQPILPALQAYGVGIY